MRGILFFAAWVSFIHIYVAIEKWRKTFGYRSGKIVVLIERGHNEIGHEYRVIVFRRFPSLVRAQSAFLSEVPESAEEQYKTTIAEQDKRDRERYETR